MTYSNTYHQLMSQESIKSARNVVPIILKMFSNTKSVVDFGCGVGSWLSVFKENGVTDIFGVDNVGIDQSNLIIPKENFKNIDLSSDADINRKFDLAITTEVAEHIKPDYADNFIKNITNLSDIIIFSAAIPRQTGLNHYNEQWPSYWQDKFEKQGYIFCDVLRQKIISNNDISIFYRQNLFVAVEKNLYNSTHYNFDRYNPDFVLIHKYYLRFFTELKWIIFYFVHEFVYNRFNGLYFRLFELKQRFLNKN